MRKIPILKFLAIPIIGLLALSFLPFTIGLGAGYFVYKKFGNHKVKYGVLTAIAVLTLFTGSAWVAGLTSEPPKTPQKQEEQIDFNKSQATKPSASQTSPTPTWKPQTAPANANIVLARVIRIIDGDTIEVDLGEGNKKTVRYIGIDTPETVDPRKDVQCFGREASAKNQELVGNGIVGLEKDVSETDRYGRLLRYVYMGDLFINQILVSEGYAHASSYPPDIKYQEKLRQAEQQARTNNKGLWSSCSSTPAPTGKSSPIVPTTTTNSNSQTSGSTSNSSAQDTGAYSCNCSKTCTQISSCAEAQYQLKSCGCSARDADGDGTACDGAPLHCQQ